MTYYDYDFPREGMFLRYEVTNAPAQSASPGVTFQPVIHHMYYKVWEATSKNKTAAICKNTGNLTLLLLPFTSWDIMSGLPLSSAKSLPPMVLAISCPYSRAEHIPCQNSWGISGNCEDPFQVKFVFHTVCQVLLFFWHVRCRLHFFPKEDPYFQQFLEMT